ncbi:unnamed protein product [Soboliphyme baturini]|uniref:Methyltranfer_dom domain-containing protein n=1 Tax=Soboliphyme baturini TaxID=241478 RepID=A0A183J651_9BILA|nr:unnamed protein product [Soboliphyme baturini]
MCEETAEAFGQRCSDCVSSGFTSLAIALGVRLKLFQNMPTCVEQATTAAALAATLGYKERYVREWLSVVVCAQFVTVDETGNKFWLPEHRKRILVSSALHAHSLGMSLMMTMLAASFRGVCSCFPIDGPNGLPYEEYSCFSEYMSGISDKIHENSLLDKFIPSIPGLVPALESGIMVLDVGCGTGTPSFLMSQKYPKSTFHGVDFLQKAIDMAEQRASKFNLQNLHYLLHSATELPKDWNERFSFVTTFDAVHDQARPDLVLSEIYRVLKPGGWFSMVDIKAETELVKNRSSPNAAMMYAISLFHCMPVSLYFKGGFGLGTMWGRRKAEQMLRESGFSQIQVIELPYNDKCYHYLCRKAKTVAQ